MLTYPQWFKKEGWKRYSLPFLFALFFDIAPIVLWHDFSRNGIGATLLETVPIIGFNIGMIYLSIKTYNKSKYSNNEGNLS